MDYNKLFQIVRELEFEANKTIYEENGTQIYIRRPREFKTKISYDINKNFQIYLKNGGSEFRPNHLRIMIDLNLRVKSRPELREELFLAFDKIFYRHNPTEVLLNLSKEDFQFELNSINIIGVLAQLFIIEQDFNYGKKSNYSRASLFFQGWIRNFILAEKEIDILAMSLCRYQPPPVGLTCREDENHKKYCAENEPLWYLK